jgi:ATP phosphoribosyltransferase regulatory subunit
MSIVDRWLLPDGVEDVLPPQAARLEQVRRRLLDLYQQWGYEYVIPPMLEFIESLLTGTGHDLDLKTFKVTDLTSGRTMGIRADITPQTARIDAHSLNREGMGRLCYAGSVLYTRSDNMLASRTPIFVGAELFGDAAGADLEIVSLMIESLNALGIDTLHIELGDVGIFRQVLAQADLPQHQQDVLFDLIQRKARAKLAESLQEYGISEPLAGLLNQLPVLCGSSDVLEEGRRCFADYPEIIARLDNLAEVTRGLQRRYQNLDVYFDLSELRGYSYHTGIVFAAYLPGLDQAVAKGGRYDHIGQVFGRSRRATGFDVNIRSLLDYANIEEAKPLVVNAPAVTDERETARWQKVQALRQEGYRIIESAMDPSGCDFQLLYQQDGWQLVPVEE